MSWAGRRGSVYNRYIPRDVSYTPVEKESRPGPRRSAFRLPDFLGGKEGLSGLLGEREGSGLSGLLKSLHLDRIDSGDVLLLLIMLYLLVEGDELGLVIALGLVLLMGLGDDEERDAT